MLTRFITAGLLLSWAVQGAALTVNQKYRLGLQHQLDYQVPLTQSTWLGTHNSFNNTDNLYPIENHRADMVEQLNAGFRVLNYDLYNPTSNTPQLCHAACSSTDKTLRTALGELKAWLNNYPNEVVFIVIENGMNSYGYLPAAQDIEAMIGDEVYRPVTHGLGDTTQCRDLPVASLTKQAVLDAGKQVILAFNGGCAGERNSSLWRYLWNVPFTAYMADDFEGQGELRSGSELRFVYEDRSFWGADLACDGNPIVRLEDEWDKAHNKEPAKLERCRDSYELDSAEITQALLQGAGMIGLDFGVDVNRHDAMIWSWPENEPNGYTRENCAVMLPGGHWNDLNCGEWRPFACKSTEGRGWMITDNTYSFAGGPSICAQQGAYVFAAPTNAADNRALRRVLDGTSYENGIWMNATDSAQEGFWSATNTALPEFVKVYQDVMIVNAQQGLSDFDIAHTGGCDAIYLEDQDRWVTQCDVEDIFSLTANNSSGSYLHVYDHISTLLNRIDVVSAGEPLTLTSRLYRTNMRVFGSDFDDQLQTGAMNDLFMGSKGSDRIEGGEGNDTVSYQSLPVGISADLAALRVSFSVGSDIDRLSGIENILGSEYDDTLSGSDDANRLVGLAGDDRLTGLAGDDWLISTAGQDTLTGGEGSDTFVIAHGEKVTITDYQPGVDHIILDAKALGIPVITDCTPDIEDYNPGRNTKHYLAYYNSGAIFLFNPEGEGKQIAELSVNRDTGYHPGQLGFESFDYNMLQTQSRLTDLYCGNKYPISTVRLDNMLDQNWLSVLFYDPGFISPAIFASAPGFTGPDGGVVRLQNSSSPRVDVAFKEWNYLDGNHGSKESVDLLVLDEGHVIMADGTMIEVGYFDLDGTATFKWQNFSGSFTSAPAVFLMPQTANGDDPLSTRVIDISKTGFRAALFEQDSLNDSGHVAERIAYLAIQSPLGYGTFDGLDEPVAYRLFRTVLDHNAKQIGSYLYHLQEEQSLDDEVEHTKETVNVLEINGVALIQQISSNGADNVSIRRQ